jgi:hypothetical protein
LPIFALQVPDAESQYCVPPHEVAVQDPVHVVPPVVQAPLEQGAGSTVGQVPLLQVDAGVCWPPEQLSSLQTVSLPGILHEVALLPSH